MRIRSRIGAFAASLVAAATAVVVSGAPAQAAPFPYQEIGVFGGNRCLDNATEINSVLQMWKCTGGDEQQWAEDFDTNDSTFFFRNLNTGWCISAPSVGTGRVEMAPCDQVVALSQKWTAFFHQDNASGFYTIWQNASSHECLETPSVNNGTLLQAVPCSLFEGNQRFFEHGF